jgi:hypothetical protein
MAKIRFTLTLPGEGPRGTWCPVKLPKKVHAALGGDKARIPIVGTANGHPIRTSATPMGGAHLFPFNEAMKKATGKGPGDRVTFEIERDDAPRTVEAPPDLAKAIKTSKDATAAWASFSFTHKKEYVVWITEAKKPETRARRIEKAVPMIAAKKPAR